MKKNLMLFLTIFMMLAVTACGGSDESTEQPSEKENVALNQTAEKEETGTESITEVETEVATEVEATETETTSESETTENTSSVAGTGSTTGNNSNGGQNTTDNSSSTTTYEDFPYELYVATFDGQYFTFYHDQTHGGYGEGWDSINAQVSAIANNNDYGYPGGTTYYGDWQNETYEVIGRYKNKSKYVSGDAMNVVRITVPFVVELPSAYDMLYIDQIDGGVGTGSNDVYFNYIEGVSDFNSLKAQADAMAEEYCQVMEAECPGVDYVTTTSTIYQNTYKEGKVYQYRCSMNVNVE